MRIRRSSVISATSSCRLCVTLSQRTRAPSVLSLQWMKFFVNPSGYFYLHGFYCDFPSNILRYLRADNLVHHSLLPARTHSCPDSFLPGFIPVHTHACPDSFPPRLIPVRTHSCPDSSLESSGQSFSGSSARFSVIG